MVKAKSVLKKIWYLLLAKQIFTLPMILQQIGTRAEHSQLLDKWNVAPRISLAYKFADKSQASFAYGIFYQDPERKYLPSSNKLDYAKATHYILQYQKLTNNRTFRTEAFYKKYDDLLKQCS